MIPTFTRWKSLAHVVDSVPGLERERFLSIGYTIGGMMVFPANRVDGKQTINGARGFNRRIADRFDLTLECIRRHYAGEGSPLGTTLARYGEFFALFGDFAGYVDFFLLGDLVRPVYAGLDFFLPFDDFEGPAVPRDMGEYVDYRDRSIAFVEARNRRIAQYLASLA